MKTCYLGENQKEPKKKQAHQEKKYGQKNKREVED